MKKKELRQRVDYETLLREVKGKSVTRPNSKMNGTLSGHAAGEPFEKLIYQQLKRGYEGNVFKQYEFLNALYQRNPQVISAEDRYALFNSPTALFLLSRSESATSAWNPTNIFEEKQNDTADILFYDKDSNYYELIDVKTRNVNKNAQPPNIISAYKLAQACAIMIDNKEYSTVSINYVEVDWKEDSEKLICEDAHFASLFKIAPENLYINWAAAMQIQFHVSEVEQSWKETMEKWAIAYISHFVASARLRCKRMEAEYITPFLKYIEK